MPALTLRSSWPDHHGDDPDATKVFYAAPPPEIGEVLSADSTFKDDSQLEHGLGGKAIAFMLGGFLGALGGVLLAFLSFFIEFLPESLSENEVFLYTVVPCIVLFGLVAAIWDSPVFRVTYVGEQGLATFERARDKITETRILFDDVDELRVTNVDHYTNGVYTGRNTTHSWVGQDGAVLQEFTTGLSSSGVPHHPEMLAFMRAGEQIWTQHKVARVQVTLEAGEPVEFRLGSDRKMVLRPGELEVVQGGDSERFPTSEIAALKLVDGAQTLEIERPGASRGFFSSTGVLSLDIRELGDRQVVAAALASIVGVELQVG